MPKHSAGMTQDLGFEYCGLLKHGALPTDDASLGTPISAYQGEHGWEMLDSMLISGLGKLTIN